MDLQVELTIDGQRQWVALQDLSRTGMFLQVSRPIPIGTTLRVAFEIAGSTNAERKRVATDATVTHLLVPEDALRLGRYPGIGIRFREPAEPGDQLFALAVERMCRAQRSSTPNIGLHIVIADADTRMLQRQSNALAEAGFSVATATTGMEAIAACLRKRPDVVVVDRNLPVFDGFRVLETLAEDGTFAAVPVVVTSADLNDLAPSFERGAMDFIAKPFTMLELIVRARRLAHASPRASDRVLLAGTLSDITLPALLTMFEIERKTGRLALTGEHVAWIDIVEGRIASAGSATGETDARAVLMTLLDWTCGSFELTGIAGPHDGDLALPITHLLLEHACLRDEQGREITPPRKRCATAPELLVANPTKAVA
jgi:CheY-like chemotaxis protein